MKNRAPLTLLVLLAAVACIRPTFAQSPEELQKRRQAVREAMDPDSVLVLRAAVSVPDVPYRQESNLFYLTGVNEPGTSLILYSSRRQAAPAAATGGTGAAGGGAARATVAEVLFLSPASGDTAAPRAGAAQPSAPPARPGFQSVRPAADFQQAFESALLSTPGTVYLDYPRTRSLSAPLGGEEQWVRAARDRGATFLLKTASSLLSPIRPVKSADEIATLKIAAEITAAAEREAMRSAKPGMFEYQIQAVVEHVFRVNGADGPGFSTIVGSGGNSCILHWSANSRQTEPGDVVVMDVGALFGMYTADITRTIPVSGTFTRRQRDVYEIVLAASDAAIKMVAPGVDMADINAVVNGVLSEGLIRLGLIEDKSGLRQYYTHGLSHSVGLQVHDLGGAVTVGILKPGMVITIEPGLYIPSEKLGIRIEDDVVVTETGRQVITAGAPKTVAEIERLMKEPGMDFSRYLIGGQKTGGGRQKAPR